MSADVVINGTTLRLPRPSDVAVAQRVAVHLHHHIAEDDWRPYRNKADAVQAWTRPWGTRLQVMGALSLLNEP